MAVNGNAARLFLIALLGQVGSTGNLGAGQSQSAAESASEKEEVSEPASIRQISVLLNRHLPAWIRFSGEYRMRVEGRGAFLFEEGADDSYLLSRLRLNLELRPARWLEFSLQGQDSRRAGVDLPIASSKLKDTFELRQVFAGVKFGEKTTAQIKGGRQELRYGTERLVGRSNWSNVGRSFDAAKLELAGDDFRLDVFGGSVVNVLSEEPNERRKGEYLYGAYGALTRLLDDRPLEIYYLRKTKKPPAGEAEKENLEDEDVNTIGFRFVSFDPTESWDLTVEAAKQWGNLTGGSLSSWAGYGVAGFTFRESPFQPRLSAEFSYASGDRAEEGKVGTFDQLYPTNHSKYGIVDAVGWRNIQDLRLGGELQLHPRLRVRIDYHSFWLASRADNLYSSGGSVLVRTPEAGTRANHVGQEVDVISGFEITDYLDLGAGFGHLFPGGYLRENSTGLGASYIYAFVTYQI
jgi:hypothetical protein